MQQRFRLAVGLSLVMCGLCGLRGAVGQEPPLPGGFWVSAGGGGGVFLGQRQFAADRRVGGAGYLRLGGTVTERLRLGGEFVGSWAGGRFDVRKRHSLTLAGLFSPFAKSGLFLKAGVGFSFVNRVEVSDSPQPPYAGDVEISIYGADMGLGAVTGVGADLGLTRRVAVTPNLDLLWLDLARGPATAFAFSLGLTVR
jgi:hypothetical protein